MKLILGTAQLGAAYGAFNTTGQVSQESVEAILATASAAGISMLDTARAYGESESVLFRAGAPQLFDIVTKCPDLSNVAGGCATALFSAFDQSCAAMGVESIYGYLLHNAADLARPGIWDALCALRDAGRVRRIGVSGYDIEEISDLCDRYPLTLVQLPANVLDPWYERSYLPSSVEVHVRSVFLQGFLLSEPQALPVYLSQFSAILERFRAEACEHGLTPLQAALAPILVNPSVDRVVVGADNIAQLTQVISGAVALSGKPAPKLGSYLGVTSHLTDPRRWRVIA